MTDAERTLEQPNEGTAPEQTEQAGGGLVSRLVDTAKSVAGTVVDVAKNVVDTVSERVPGLGSGASDTSGNGAAADDTAGASAAVAASDNGGATSPVAASDNGAATSPVAAVRTRVYDVATTVASTASDAAETVAETVADTVGGAVQAVRSGLTRIYDVVTGEQGASYEPPAQGEKERGGGRPRRFKDVSAGMQLEGKVTSIALYGIFVDVGVGRDGLVHISEMSDKRIDSPTDVVQIGTPVTVWVKSVDPDARRISLTMRDPNRQKPERQERRQPRKPEVNREKLASLRPGMDIEGAISSVAPFGAFVDIGVGKDGLVHISELAEGRVDKPEDAVTIGERYTFKILEVDPDGNRISLSLRRVQRAQKMQQLEPGTELDGTISGLAPFGAFVDVGVGRDGLVHVSELSPERVNKVEDVVKVGDKVKVRVLEVDPNSKRISLTMRVDEPMPAERPRPAPRAGGPSAEGGPVGAPSGFGGPSFGGGGRPSFGEGGGRPTGTGGGRPAFGEGGGDSRGGGRGDSRGGGRGDSRGGGRGTSFGGGGGGDDRPARSRGRGNEGGGDRARSGPGGGGGGRRRDSQYEEPTQEVYTFEEPEEEFTGDASLQDLLSKFNSGKGRDSRKKAGDEQDDQEGQQRNDAIRRTLAMRDEE